MTHHQTMITSQLRRSEHTMTTPTSFEATPTNDKVKTPYFVRSSPPSTTSRPLSSPSSPYHSPLSQTSPNPFSLASQR